MTHAENPRSARQLIRGGPYALTVGFRWVRFRNAQASGIARRQDGVMCEIEHAALSCKQRHLPQVQELGIERKIVAPACPRSCAGEVGS